METILTDRLATLSHPQRMAIFRLLMRRCPDALPAGEIVAALNLKASTASVYLSALTQTNLISQRRDGTRLLYTINLDTARDVVAGLFFDCCRGRADLCPPAYSGLLKGISPATDPQYNVLFLCTGNAARSIMAEAILRDLAGTTFNAFSAGTAHRPALDPSAIAVLQSKGHDVSGLHSKNISVFQRATAPQMDFVFTVCDRAANEDCPAWPGHPITGHWGVPDPVRTEGTKAENDRAYHDTYRALHNRMTAFTALSFTTLSQADLQKQIDAIGDHISQ